MQDFEAWAKSKGFDTSAITAEQRVSLEGMWRRETQPAPVHTPTPATAQSGTETLDEIVARTNAENERQRAITALVAQCLKDAPDQVATLEPIGRVAIASKWTKEQTELHLLRASRPAGPHVHMPSMPQVDDVVVEAAFCRAAGMSADRVEAHFDDKTLSAADSKLRSGVGLHRLLKMGAQSNGYRDAQMDGRQEIRSTLRAAFRPVDDGNYNGLSSGPSTINVPGILSDAGSKFSKDAFNAVEAKWRPLVSTRPVNDFKTYTTHTLTGDLTYKTLGPGGTIKEGKLGETEYSNRAVMRAIMLGLDYQQIRNDDLGEFAKLNRKMGRGGALTINKIFFTKLNSNEYDNGDEFFSVANGNYRANTDVAFGLAGLKVASTYLDAQTDPDGQPLGTGARYLVVPSALSLDADEAMSSTLLGRDDAGGTRNVLAGKWTPVSSNYLDNATYVGNSPVNYYLWRDPADLAAIEICFLDGAESPTIESAEAEFTQLGITIRAYHAFGVEFQETRGAYKFKPTADA